MSSFEIEMLMFLNNKDGPSEWFVALFGNSLANFYLDI